MLNQNQIPCNIWKGSQYQTSINLHENLNVILLLVITCQKGLFLFCLKSCQGFPALRLLHLYSFQRNFPGGSDGKVSTYNAGDPGLIPGLGRSPGEGNDNPLQYSCLENPMDGMQSMVSQSQTWLSDFTFLSFPFIFKIAPRPFDCPIGTN